MTDYEHAGTWDCAACGAEYEVETKSDVLVFALTHECDGEGGDG
jgi:hypothetical protein